MEYLRKVKLNMETFKENTVSGKNLTVSKRRYFLLVGASLIIGIDHH